MYRSIIVAAGDDGGPSQDILQESGANSPRNERSYVRNERKNYFICSYIIPSFLFSDSENLVYRN